MSEKKALITGITGQDGAYLAQHLLEQGYRVSGIQRAVSPIPWRLNELKLTENPALSLMQDDLADIDSHRKLLDQVQPDEIYNLAGVSSLAVANENPLQASIVNGIIPVALLEAIHQSGAPVRFFQASSAEIFGNNRCQVQTEDTPLAPVGSYAITKAHAHRMVEFYREQHGLFACNGILYNHESPLRGEQFVSRKITQGLSEVVNGTRSALEIGNLDALRDWGYAPDYVQAMHAMLQVDKAETYILCTGHLSSVRAFIEAACAALSIQLEWSGSGLDEIGLNAQTGATLVTVNPKYFRPEATNNQAASAQKAYDLLNWKAGVGLEELCELMVAYDMKNYAALEA